MRGERELKKYILHNRWGFLLLLIFKVINIGIVLGFSFIIRNLINIAFEDKPLEQLQAYIPYCLVYAIVLVVVYCMTSVIYTKYYNKCIYLLKKDYLHILLNSSYENIVKKDSAYYISALTNDVMLITNNFVTAVFIMIDECITLIGAFACIFILNKLIALIMFVIVIIISIIPLLFKEIMNTANNQVSEKLEQYTTGIKDILGGIDVIKTYQLEDIMENKLQVLNNDVRYAKIHRDYKGTILSAITSSTTNILKMGLVMITIYYISCGKMDIGSVSALLTLTSYFFAPIESLTNQVGCIMGSRDIRKKFLSIMDKYKVLEKVKKNDTLETNDLLSVRNVSYSYDQNRFVLKNISLDIKKNKKYLILGESGGGKSTLLKLLSKMYTNYEGSIYLNGIDYQELTDREMNEIITYSHQRTYLFQGTIEENIILNNTREVDKLNKCIQICQLNNFIQKLSNGIETNVSEEVNRLSEGEKLRIGLARTLYRDNEVLLLDEITASLDSTNSLEIENMILSIKDKTIMNICHKFSESIASKYDEIIIIENGNIAIMGDYECVSKSPLYEKYKFQSNK